MLNQKKNFLIFILVLAVFVISFNAYKINIEKERTNLEEVEGVYVVGGFSLAYQTANSNWWNESWPYRLAIYVKDNTGKTWTNINILIRMDTETLISQDKMKSDCSDIRFTDSNGNLIPYWIESGCNTRSTKIWILLPKLEANSQEIIYMYYGNPDASPASNKDKAFPYFMEVKKINVPSQDTAGQWFQFYFDNEFPETPIVIAEPDMSYNGGQEMVFRLKDITTTSFYIRQQEPSNRDDSHTSETVTYIAIPPGAWTTIEGDVLIQAGRFQTNKWLAGDNNAYDNWNDPSYFEYPYTNAPVVFTQIQDYTYTGFAQTRIKETANDYFITSPEPEGDVIPAPTTTVTIGWIAINKSFVGTIDGLLSETGTVSGECNVDDGTWCTINFKNSYSNPVGIAMMQTYNGGDAAHLRGDDITSTSWKIRIEEDQTKDDERDHCSETHGYWIIENPGRKVYLRKYIEKEPTVTFGPEESLYGLDICGIVFRQPWFDIKARNGSHLLIIDSQGNLYINSSSVSLNTVVSKAWQNAFLIYSNVLYSYIGAFNHTKAEINGSIIEEGNPTYGPNSFIILNRSNNAVLAVFNGSTGDIIIRGKAVYQGAQAGCPTILYCKGDERYAEKHFCDVLSKSCKITISEYIENCSEYDGWYCKDSSTKEYRDYYCSNGECKYSVTQTEACPSDYYYCSGDSRYLRDYYCSNGECKYSNKFIENCDSYDGWYCSSDVVNRKEYRDYTCSDGKCKYSVTQTVTCDPANACPCNLKYVCAKCDDAECKYTCSNSALSGWKCLSASLACQVPSTAT